MSKTVGDEARAGILDSGRGGTCYLSRFLALVDKAMAYPFVTEIEPSALCLGTCPFGSNVTEEESFRVLDAFVAGGGNFVDTAHIYAAWLEDGWGASERTVGEWLRVHGARNEILLGTKGGHPPLDNMAFGRCSETELERDLTESLERLGVDYVDVYWLHRDDPGRPVADIMETLAGFVRDGRIRSYGASNWSTDRIMAANDYALERGLPPFAASQCGWAVADLPAGMEAQPGMLYVDGRMRQWHVESGFTLAAYSSQAHGYFGAENVAWAKAGFEGRAPRARQYDSPVNRRRLSAAMELARQKGCSANQINLAYLLNQPFPVIPIIGTHNLEHLAEAMAAVSISLDERQCASMFPRKNA